jgi:sec-independent protein translocase protein TatC
MNWLSKIINNVFSLRERSQGDVMKPFLEHMEDLRWTLIKMGVTLAVGIGLSFFFVERLSAVIRAPLEAAADMTFVVKKGSAELETADSTAGVEVGRVVKGEGIPEGAKITEVKKKGIVLSEPAERDGSVVLRSAEVTARRPLELQVLGVTDSFMISLSMAFYCGIVLTFPVLVYFLTEFILPALTTQERRVLLPGVVIGFVLFAAGVWVSHQYVLPMTLKWFYNYSMNMGLDPRWGARDYYGFVAHLAIACGLFSELPVGVIGLAAIGLVRYRFLADTRPYAVTVIMLLVAFIAPTPDPMTFLILAVPVIAIYELCIWIVYFMDLKKMRAESSEIRTLD